MPVINLKERSTIYLRLPGKPDRVDAFYQNGQLHFFRFINGKYDKIKFNLTRPGMYNITDGEIEKIVPIEIEPLNIILPEPDRDRLKPYKIVYNPNLKGTPARNFTLKGIIEYGDKFKALPYPVRVFILLHEVGHFHFKNETLCDLFAAREYIKAGFNNSVACYSLLNVLNRNSPENMERCRVLFDNLKK